MEIKPEMPCHIVIKARQLFMSEAVIEAAEESESCRPEPSEANEDSLNVYNILCKDFEEASPRPPRQLST